MPLLDPYFATRRRLKVALTVAGFFDAFSLKARATVLLLLLSACTKPQSVATTPSPTTTTTIFTRIPSQVGNYRLTERAVVRGVPTDSLFRFSDGSSAIVTAFVYSISEDVRIDADSQKWTPREGSKFRLVQDIRKNRGDFADFAVAVSDTTRLTFGKRGILEHEIVTPVRLKNGAVIMDFQFLYLIDAKFFKVRATIRAEGWEKTTVKSFARELARQVAGPG